MSQNRNFKNQKTVVKIGIVLGALSLLAIVVVACSAGSGGGGGPTALPLTLAPAMQSVTIGNPATVTVSTLTAPAGDVTVLVIATPADSRTVAAVKPALLDANNSSASVDFSTGPDNDLPTTGTYNLSVTVTAGTALVTGSPTATITILIPVDTDGDSVFDDDDAFPQNACATTNSDGDALPDTIFVPGAAGSPATCTEASALALATGLLASDDADQISDCMADDVATLAMCADPDDDDDSVLDSNDEFSLDASRSCTIAAANMDSAILDCDNDMAVNNADNCPAVANSGQEEDAAMIDGMAVTDADTVGDACDVDIDDDGLIEITTAAELNNMRHNLAGTSYDDEAADRDTGDGGSSMGCSSGGCNGYELVEDIDLATASSGMYANWVPIGEDTKAFTATFDGNRHSIVGLAISTNSGTSIGLFGTVSGSSTIIRNLHIAGTIDYTGSTGGVKIGGLVGNIEGSTTISNCSAAVNMTGGGGTRQFVGGLVGRSQAIENSWANGTVSSGSGTGAIGGLVGQNDGRVNNSFATGAVSGNAPSASGLGGLVGVASSPIENSWTSSTVTGGSGGDLLGGLIGWNLGGGTSLSASYAGGAVDGGDGSDIIGGLVGLQSSSTMENSYYSGTVDGAAGTAVGTSNGTLTNVAGLTPAQLRMATAAMATISPVVDGTNMLACIAAGGTFTMGTPGSCTGQATTVYVGWSTNSWDFGTASQFPALRSYKENSSGTQIAGDIMCGQPGQTGTPQTRATRPECVDALVPLP